MHISAKCKHSLLDVLFFFVNLSSIEPTHIILGCLINYCGVHHCGSDWLFGWVNQVIINYRRNVGTPPPPPYTDTRSVLTRPQLRLYLWVVWIGPSLDLACGCVKLLTGFYYHRFSIKFDNGNGFNWHIFKLVYVLEAWHLKSNVISLLL